MELTARQTQFVDAGLHLLARAGIGAVTFRAIAAEAGMSVGAVQKAFSTKEALLAAMFARLRARAAAPTLGDPGRPTLRVWLTDLTLQILPLDQARRDAQLQGNAFAEFAAYDEVIAGAIDASDREILTAVAGLVDRAVAEAEIAPVESSQTIAEIWLALANGLATQLLYAPRPQAEVRGLLTVAFARLLPDAP